MLPKYKIIKDKSQQWILDIWRWADKNKIDNAIIPRKKKKLLAIDKLLLDNMAIQYVPKSIGNLTKLTVLVLSNNELTKLPKSIGNLVNLEKLILYNNKLTKLPKSIGNLINLKKLILCNNNLTKVPKKIKYLVNLEISQIDIYIVDKLKKTSIGLHYDSEIMDAPLIISKKDNIPNNNIIKVENTKLLSLLYDTFNIGDEITQEFYEDVAPIIMYGNNMTISIDNDKFKRLINIEIISIALSSNLYQTITEENKIDIENLQKKLSKQLGFKIPTIVIKEDIELIDGKYIISLKNDNNISHSFDIFDILVDTLETFILKYSQHLLTLDNLLELLDIVKQSHPKVIIELQNHIGNIDILKLCQHLLKENIPLTDILTIAEAICLCDFANMNFYLVLDHVRSKIAKTITKQYISSDNKLHIITLDGLYENKLLSKIETAYFVSTLSLGIVDMENLIASVKEALKNLNTGNIKIVIVVDPALRTPLYHIFEQFSIDLPVLSLNQIDNECDIELESPIKLPE
jgi:Leucine-rich repeat (LRR) protein